MKRTRLVTYSMTSEYMSPLRPRSSRESEIRMRVYTQVPRKHEGISWRRQLFLPKAARVDKSGHRVGSARGSLEELLWLVMTVGAAVLICGFLAAVAAWLLVLASLDIVFSYPSSPSGGMGVIWAMWIGGADAALGALLIAIFALARSVTHFIGAWRLRTATTTWVSMAVVLALFGGVATGVAWLVKG